MRNIFKKNNFKTPKWLKNVLTKKRKLNSSPDKQKVIKTLHENKYKLNEVFGISNRISATYTERHYVDNEFIKALNRNKHIVIYGCSKQGKTSLRKKHLNPSNSIVIQCTNWTTREKIYELILKEIGIELSSSSTETNGNIKKFDLSVSGKQKFVVGEVNANVTTSHTRNKTETITKNSFSIDPRDINDIIRVLVSVRFQGWIVIEDFHYLSNEEQLHLSADLKAIYERSESIRVVIIGVWLESSKLTKLNGDLEGRISHINADVWEENELKEVLKKGEELLNINFSETARDKIIFYCKNNVGLLHQIAERVCDEVRITQTQSKSLILLDQSEINSIPNYLADIENMKQLNKEIDQDKLLLETFGVVNTDRFESFNYHGGPLDLWLEQLSKGRSHRYSKFLREFSNGPESYSGSTYKLIISSIIRASIEELQCGITIKQVCSYSSKYFDSALSKQEVRSILHNIRDFHLKLNVQPPILDFDSTEDTIKVVDSGLLLYHSTHTVNQMLTIVGWDVQNR